MFLKIELECNIFYKKKVEKCLSLFSYRIEMFFTVFFCNFIDFSCIKKQGKSVKLQIWHII